MHGWMDAWMDRYFTIYTISSNIHKLKATGHAIRVVLVLSSSRVDDKEEVQISIVFGLQSDLRRVALNRQS